jgi:hypothetical protein
VLEPVVCAHLLIYGIRALLFMVYIRTWEEGTRVHETVVCAHLAGP